MKSLRFSLVAIAASCLLTAAAFAGDPTGTWTWSMSRNGNTRTTTLKLDLKDGNLTGSISGRNGDTPISDATFKDNAIAFSITTEFNGNKATTKYTGTLDGDTIKGSIERPGRDGGDPMKTDWTATRGKADAPPAT